MGTSSKFTPSVTKPWLLLAAGLVWSMVGAMLCGLAAGWLSGSTPAWSVTAWAAGLLASLVIYRLGFVKIAHHNRDRIQSLTARTCLFAFYPVKSYLLVAGMMAGGIFLRSTAIPKPYLAVLYLAIGAALFISSLHYYRPAYRGFRSQSTAE
jgi:hypothetical protein